MSIADDAQVVPTRQPDLVSVSVALTMVDPAGIDDKSSLMLDAQWWVPSDPAFRVPLPASGQSEPEQAPGSVIASAAVTCEPVIVAVAVATGGGGAPAALTV